MEKQKSLCGVPVEGPKHVVVGRMNVSSALYTSAIDINTSRQFNDYQYREAMAENQVENNNEGNAKQPSNSSSVKVCCRIRPMNRKEKGLKSGVCAEKANDTTVYIMMVKKGPMTNVSFILTIFLALKVRRQKYLNCAGKTIFWTSSAATTAPFLPMDKRDGKTFTMEVQT